MELQTYLQCRKGVRCFLLMTLAKSIAEITTNYNPLFRDTFHPIRVLLQKIRTREGDVIVPFEKVKEI